MVKHRQKENNDNIDDWRSSSTKTEKRRLSRGISPSRFHAHHAQDNSAVPSYQRAEKLRTQQYMQTTKDLVSSSLIEGGKRRVGHEKALRRAAYKQVTECKSWPLQEPALEHYHRLIQQHLSSTQNDTTAIGSTDTTNHKICSFSGSSSLTSSSSSSNFSVSPYENEEAKRLMRTLYSSPQKSSLSGILRDDFLQEQALPSSLPPPPWSRSMKTTNPVSTNTRDIAISSQQQENNPLATVTETLLQRPALWSMEPCIWALEINNTGKRKYVVGHLGRCLDWYWRKTLPENRHAYELLRQDTPCRLYLDIEYATAENPHLTDPKPFLSALFDELKDYLHQTFPNVLPDTLQRSDIVDLDSTTEKKFSRHWIVHLPGHYLFSSNRAVGRFVHEWVRSMMRRRARAESSQERNVSQTHTSNSEEHETSRESSIKEGNGSHINDDKPLDPALMEYLMVQTKNNGVNQPTCIIDMGVYTKNRLFRLLGSCKYGKPASAALRISPENEFPFGNFDNSHFYKFSESSKATPSNNPSNDNVKAHSDFPEMKDVLEYKATIDWEPHAHALAQTLVIPINSSKIKYPILSDLPNTFETMTTGIPGCSRPARPGGTFARQSYGASPLPLLDEYVLTHLATRGGVQGSIRTWSLETREDLQNGEPNVTTESTTGSAHPSASSRPVLMSYYLNRNRYCENIKRHHKSNGIFWEVDLVTFQARQRCFDPDCRGFSSQPFLLPNYVKSYVQSLAHESQQESDSASSRRRDNDQDNASINDLSEAVQSLRLDAVSAASSLQSPVSTLTEPAEFESSLSDEALLDAMLANPELFP